MKNILISLLVSSLSILTYAQEKFTFSGTTQSGINSIYLKKYVGAGLYNFDTIEVKKQKFKKTYSSFDRGLYSLTVNGVSGEIVLWRNKVTISTEGITTEMPWKSNSEENLDYYNIRENNLLYDRTLQGLDETYNSFAHLREAKPDFYNEQVTELREGLKKANEDFDNFYKQLATDAHSAYGKQVGKFYSSTSATTEKDYFRKEELTNSLFSSGDYISRKLNYQFMKYARIDPNNISLQSQKILGFAQEKNLNKELLYEVLIRNVIALSENEARSLQIQHKNEFGNSLVAERIAFVTPPPPPSLGEKVPEIIAKDINGNEFKLSNLKGKVVLIDFWASWCGPCRRESPNVVANYNKYKEKGFTVVSISADKPEQRDRWVDAIAHDNYTWNNHILSAENNYKAQRDYQVRGYPTMFLLDRNGVLVSTGAELRGPNLEVQISKIINK